MHGIAFPINREEDYNFRKLQTNGNIIYTLYKETKYTQNCFRNFLKGTNYFTNKLETDLGNLVGVSVTYSTKRMAYSTPRDIGSMFQSRATCGGTSSRSAITLS